MENKPSTEQLLELLKYYTAESLKNEQTKLTKAANQVREVGNGRLRVLFTDAEQETLVAAANLLQSLKTRVERAKEVKARAEQQAEKMRAENKQAANRILAAAIPSESADHAGRIELLAWALVLHKNHRFCRYGNHGWISYSGHYHTFKEELQSRFRAAAKSELHPDRRIERQARPPYETVTAFFNDLRRMVVDSLKDEFSDEKASFPEAFDSFRVRFEMTAMPELQESEKDFLSQFHAQLQEEGAAKSFVSNVVAGLKK